MSEYLDRQRARKEEEQNRQAAGLSQGAMDAIRDFQAQGGQIPQQMMGLMQNGGQLPPGAMDAIRDFQAKGGQIPPQMMGLMQSMPAAEQTAEDMPPEEKKAPRMNQDRIRQAIHTLQEYKSGKARLEKRLVANEKWWEGRAWNLMEEQGNGQEPKRPTMWLFNTIMGKHADMMEAYPEPVILPREQGDEEEARKLTSILPVVLEQNHFEETYSLQAWEKNKHGTGVYAVYWDNTLHNGLGDISIVGIDLINLYWEPGIDDIEKSQNIFHVTKEDAKLLKEKYPQLEGKNLDSVFSVEKYETESQKQNNGDTLVVDWYYHTYEHGQKMLHYCKFCGLEVLYSSEDDETLQGRGWYDDGEYPFVFDRLFPKKGTPVGKGYIDLGRNAQEEIDLLNYAVQINARAGAIPRWLISNDANVNEKEWLDFTKPFVHVEGGTVNETNCMPMAVNPLNGNYLSVLNNKIEELKQVTGNQDVTNGITSGVTAASGIAAQMEAAGRSSRDGNKGTYRAYSRILEKVIERIRQFYDMPRQFRILGANGQMQFTSYDNSGLQMQPQEEIGGMDMGLRKPLFDIQVSAQKQNPYSKMANNELALQLLNAGVFTPQMADQSTLLLSMMDFSKKDDVLRKIQSMSQTMQQLAMWQQMAMGLAQKYEPETAEQMAQSVLQQQQGTMTAGGGQEISLEGSREDKRMQAARERSRNASQIE